MSPKVQCPNPLKPEDCHTINQILSSIAQTRELINKCKNCGIPVEEWEAGNNAQEELMVAVKREFFPNNP